jgi:hypothetical protein
VNELDDEADSAHDYESHADRLADLEELALVGWSGMSAGFI